jgi:ABC-type transport system involved in multi-copper enzyme maturation permease subunit
MKKIITVECAGKLLIGLMLLLILFHVMVLVSVVPRDFVWGGRLETQADMYQFEIVALIMSLIFMAVICMKVSYLKKQKKSTILNIGLWIIFSYFLFNIVGNLASKATLETYIFTPLSLILVLLIFRLIIENK